MIDFTRPYAVLANIKKYAASHVSSVIGTTGWYDNLPEVTRAVEAAGTALLYAPNFSVGVSIFNKLAVYAAQLFSRFPEYDAAGFELHHNKKIDSPSGTARVLVNNVLQVSKAKKRALYEKAAPEKDELHFASLRVGSVPGTHTFIFDSPADTVELTHRARSRIGFASGAIAAAAWLVSKKRNGIFTLDDILNEGPEDQ